MVKICELDSQLFLVRHSVRNTTSHAWKFQNNSYCCTVLSCHCTKYNQGCRQEGLKPTPPKIWSSCYYTQLPQKDIQNLEIKMNSALITCNKLNPRLTLPQLLKSCLSPSDNRPVLTSNNTMKTGCSERPGSNLGTCVYSIMTLQQCTWLNQLHVLWSRPQILISQCV